MTDAYGMIALDYAPIPVVGTFWPYAPENDVEIEATTSAFSTKTITNESDIVNQFALLKANLGATLSIRETNGSEAQGVLVETGTDYLLFKTNRGTKMMNFSSIAELIFVEPPKTKTVVSSIVQEPELRLRISSNKKVASNRKTTIGMMYLQQGIRWVPNYRVDIDDNGNARVRLQATIINELIDFENADINLVVGVPSFLFKDKIDGIALSRTLERMSQNNLRSFPNNPRRGEFDNFYNGVCNQIASMHPIESSGTGTENDLNLKGSDDLFIFRVKSITLKKGETQVITLSDFRLNYKDIYKLKAPAVAPRGVRGNNKPDSEYDKMAKSPKVKHYLRLTNSADAPLTTAPALIFKNNAVIAQGMMTYTSPGAASDLELTTAINIIVKIEEEETERIPNSISYEGNQFGRINAQCAISIKNMMKNAVTVDVEKAIFGIIDDANGNGGVKQLSDIDEWIEPDYRNHYYAYSFWYDYWWRQLNGFGKASWTITIQPGEKVTVGCRWHFFWR
ncbi:MAG: hypothetical protein ABIH86_01020 [Planctomycetota bacterium]